MTTDSNRSAPPAATIKRCPFCADPGELVGAIAHGFGVRCCGCNVVFPAIHQTPEAAISLWNNRRGTVSSIGGRATAGVSSRKKRRACRRNLKRARKARALKRIWTRVESLMPQLRAERGVEMTEAKQASAASRARVEALLARHGAILGLRADDNPSGSSETGEPSVPMAGRGEADDIRF